MITIGWIAGLIQGLSGMFFQAVATQISDLTGEREHERRKLKCQRFQQPTSSNHSPFHVTNSWFLRALPFNHALFWGSSSPTVRRRWCIRPRNSVITPEQPRCAFCAISGQPYSQARLVCCAICVLWSFSGCSLKPLLQIIRLIITKPSTLIKLIGPL